MTDFPRQKLGVRTRGRPEHLTDLQTIGRLMPEGMTLVDAIQDEIREVAERKAELEEHLRLLYQELEEARQEGTG